MQTTTPIPQREQFNAEHTVKTKPCLDSFAIGPPKQTRIYRIHNGAGWNPPPTEEPPIETLDGLFASLYLFKLYVDLSLAVGIQGDMNDMAVFALAFCFNVIFQIFNPSISGLSVDNAR